MGPKAKRVRLKRPSGLQTTLVPALTTTRLTFRNWLRSVIGPARALLLLLFFIIVSAATHHNYKGLQQHRCGTANA